jgi:hypothetical protein
MDAGWLRVGIQQQRQQGAAASVAGDESLVCGVEAVLMLSSEAASGLRVKLPGFLADARSWR